MYRFLIIFAVFIGLNLFASSAYAGTYCNAQDIPDTEVITGASQHFSCTGGVRYTTRVPSSSSSTTICGLLTNHVVPVDFVITAVWGTFSGGSSLDCRPGTSGLVLGIE